MKNGRCPLFLKKGCLRYLGIVVILFIIIYFFTLLYYRCIFIRLPLYGKVYDSKTKKPIGYCIIKTTMCWDYFPWETELDGTITNKNGSYRFLPSIKIINPFLGTAESDIGPTPHRRAGYKLYAWFPGYRIYTIDTVIYEWLLGRHDIYLEKSETAEEAVGILNSCYNEFPPGPYIWRRHPWYKDFQEIQPIYTEEVIKECVKIVKTFPKSEIADKSFEQLSIWAHYGNRKLLISKIDKDICNYLLSEKA